MESLSQLRCNHVLYDVDPLCHFNLVIGCKLHAFVHVASDFEHVGVRAGVGGQTLHVAQYEIERLLCLSRLPILVHHQSSV